ncbi:hypothetical protein J3R82DRAFT_650 [Butyriboletus roseoflavus]|nr:hypothetical protein J3R82DRAFT_650 [Butyriboletus roseoflavus]
MARPFPKLEPDDDAAGLSFVSTYNPLRIVASIIRRCVVCLFPPATTLRIASHLVPLFVCLSLIPLVLFFSLFSGWYIWKNIPIAWQVPIYLQYGDGPSPYAELSLPPLSTVQPYDISLQLVLPASEANFALGNFMTTLSLSTPSNKTLVTISRPTLAARDGWKSLGDGMGRELSVWNAALKGVVRRHGIRGLVSRFPLTFALVGSAAFFSLCVIILAACILPAVQWRVSTDETLNASETKEDRPSRVRKRPRRNVAGESRVPSTVFKSEDVPVDIRSTLASDDAPLKRRRSRMSDVLLDSEN